MSFPFQPANVPEAVLQWVCRGRSIVVATGEGMLAESGGDGSPSLSTPQRDVNSLLTEGHLALARLGQIKRLTILNQETDDLHERACRLAPGGQVVHRVGADVTGAVMTQSREALNGADVVLVAGALGDKGALSGLVSRTASRGCPVVELNAWPTTLSPDATFCWRSTPSVGLPALVRALKGCRPAMTLRSL